MPDLLTVSQVAHVLQCSDDSVVRRFSKLPGVIDLGTQTTRKKRRYRVLRIPKDVVEKYLAGKSGRIIRIDVPVKADRRRKSEAWEDKAVLNLAKAALQNECQDRKAYQRITDGHVS